MSTQEQEPGRSERDRLREESGNSNSSGDLSGITDLDRPSDGSLEVSEGKRAKRDSVAGDRPTDEPPTQRRTDASRGDVERGPESGRGGRTF